MYPKLIRNNCPIKNPNANNKRYQIRLRSANCYTIVKVFYINTVSQVEE